MLVGIALVVFAGALGVTGESNVTHFTGVAVEDLLRVAPQGHGDRNRWDDADANGDVSPGTGRRRKSRVRFDHRRYSGRHCCCCRTY